MNPRQRRGVLFILLAGLGALVVFFMVARYVGNVNSQVAPLVTVYKAATNIPAYRELSSANVVAVQIPQRYVPPRTLREGAQLSGQRVGFTVAKGTLIGSDMLLPPSELNDNEREIAIQVDAVTGIAGRVATGDFVDIYAVFARENGGGTSSVLVQNVRVVSVGGRQTRSRETGEGALREQQILPVTVALEPEDALKVTYADSFAVAVRLVGLPPGIQTEDRTEELSSVSDRTVISEGRAR
ncbi:Flp pilus assembly protein CpaB [Nocardioides mesophilus]|uniref:Flp pilus assembly protein CpaB n=1 Tax=Nocardioides mesophilus TaxID=433659 RepID=A0A7G9REX9_9ACTN|nr:Flp pilus assembly protein CpaB [Nocardioides mesophilus]QNN54154.1 Flp pilus assembly protein CpaB [Nocardioides mesophilus]